MLTLIFAGFLTAVGFSIAFVFAGDDFPPTNVRKRLTINLRKREFLQFQVKTVVEAVLNGTVKASDVDYNSLRVLLKVVEKAYRFDNTEYIVRMFRYAIDAEEFNYPTSRVAFVKNVFTILNEMVVLAENTPSARELKQSGYSKTVWGKRWYQVGDKVSALYTASSKEKETNSASVRAFTRKAIL